MRKVDDYIKEKMKKKPNFRARYDLISRKAAVAKKIIEYRIKHNLSQAEPAEEIGVTQQYISKIEEGEFSHLGTVENVLHYIGYRLKIEVVRLPESHLLSKKHTEQLTAV